MRRWPPENLRPADRDRLVQARKAARDAAQAAGAFPAEWRDRQRAGDFLGLSTRAIRRPGNPTIDDVPEGGDILCILDLATIRRVDNGAMA